MRSSPLDQKFSLNWTGLNCKRLNFQSSPVQSSLVFDQYRYSLSIIRFLQRLQKTSLDWSRLVFSVLIRGCFQLYIGTQMNVHNTELNSILSTTTSIQCQTPRRRLLQLQKQGQKQKPLQRSKDLQRERKYKLPENKENQKMMIQLTLINPLT